MKHVNQLALGVVALLLAGTAFAQTTPTYRSGSSIYDDPGTLGHSFLDVNYSFVDFTEDDIEADGFVLGLNGNAPVARGLDAGLGYSYYRENDHINPFNNSEFDIRAHQLAGNLTLYAADMAIRPFLSGGIGYQWARGDLQDLDIDNNTDEWLWGGTLGAQIPLGRFAVTPRVSYTDLFRGGYEGQWSYGAEAHTWFTEGLGGYVDATFHDPRSNFEPETWTYTAGVRFRF